MMSPEDIHRFADAMEEGEHDLSPSRLAHIIREIARGDYTLHQMIELYVPEDSL